MPEPFKNQLNSDVIKQLAYSFAQAWPGFDQNRFQHLANEGLETLELKQRVVHIRQALALCLPDVFEEAATIIEAALMPAATTSTPWELKNVDGGLSGWAIWPLTDFIAHAGLAHPERALHALHALTQRFTAEFAVRPFLQQHPQLTLAMLTQWVDDSSEHVRRLVSEGTRPRLPWGLRLQAFVANPSPCLPLLNALRNDPSEYVRRSVANHLNDISKDHADLAVSIGREWMEAGNKDTQRLVRHALRSLIKQGHAGALALLGFVDDGAQVSNLRLESAIVARGGSVRFLAEICNTGPGPARLCIDYAIHHRKANGMQSAKVFKLSVANLAAGASLSINKAHSFRLITTRSYHAGTHAVEILVNGRSLALANFELLGES